MRSISLLLFLLLCAVASFSYAQDWRRVRSFDDYSVTGISFVNPDTGFMVSQGGVCGITYDGCENWVPRLVSSEAILEDVHFLNNRLGLTCGRYGRIFRTTDGGMTWQNVSFPDSTAWFISIRLLDEERAVAVGFARTGQKGASKGVLLTSADGGQTWEQQTTSGVEFGNLFVSDNGNIYFQSWGFLHMSRDKGKTWRAIKTLDGKPGRATAIRGAAGMLVGNHGMTARSTDNGQTWEPTGADSTMNYTSVVMPHPDTVFVGGHGGVVLKSIDGAQTWTEEYPPQVFDIYELAIVGDYLYCAGTGGSIARLKIR